jgi:hypothetical protein
MFVGLCGLNLRSNDRRNENHGATGLRADGLRNACVARFSRPSRSERVGRQDAALRLML